MAQKFQTHTLFELFCMHSAEKLLAREKKHKKKGCHLIPLIYSCYYRKRGSASYIVREVLLVRERERYREREREKDGSDVTIVALKLAMNLHFPLPKICTIGDKLTLSLAKNSHFSFLASHFPSLPSGRGQHGGAEIRNEFTLSIAKNFFRPQAFYVPPLSNGTSRATSDRKPKTNDQILPSPILFFPSKN